MIDPAPSIQDLLQEKEYVRRMAARFARDLADAEDLEQRAWLGALTHPPVHGRGLRSWFRTMLRHLAINTAQSERHRSDREALVHQPRHAPSAETELEQRELQQDIARAIEALGAPYAETLRLRYFEGLPPRRIAAMTRVPIETVYTRLKRGQARLREQLDARYGSRRNWCLLLLGRRSPQATAGSATPATSVAFVSLAVACLGFALWKDAGIRPSSALTPRLAPDALLQGPLVAAPAPAKRRTTPDVLAPALQVAADTPAEERATAVLPPPRDQVQVLALAIDGSPLPNTEILVRESGSPTGKGSWRSATRTDQRGRATIDKLTRNTWVSGEGPGLRPSLARLALDRDADGLLRLWLHPGTRLLGRVLDEQGRGISGARIEVQDQFDGTVKLRREGYLAVGRCPAATHSVRDGHFELQGMLRRPQQLLVSAPGMRPLLIKTSLFSRKNPQLQQLDIVLEPADQHAPVHRIYGTLSDARGEPAAHRRIVVEKHVPERRSPLAAFNPQAPHAEIWSDEAGDFSIELDRDQAWKLWCFDQGQAGSAPRQPQGVASVAVGQSEVHLRLTTRPAAKLTGLIDSSLPPQSWLLLDSSSLYRPLAQQPDRQSGEFAFQHLPAGTYRLSLWTPGQLHNDVQVLELGPGEQRSLSTLSPPTRGQLKIQIVPDPGVSLAQSWVKLDLGAGHSQLVAHGMSWPAANYSKQGLLWLKALPEGPVELTIGGPGIARETHRFDVRAGRAGSATLKASAGREQPFEWISSLGPIGQVEFELLDRDRRSVLRRSMRSQQLAARFRLRLQPGDYSLVYSHNGLPDKTEPLRVPDEDPSLIQLQL